MIAHHARGKERVLVAYYDYKVIVHTFDIIVFIANAHMEMQRRGANSLDLVLLCDREDPERGDQPYVTKDNFRMYLHNFVLENLELFSYIRNVYCISSRKTIIWFYLKNLFKKVFPIRYEDYLISSTIKRCKEGYKVPCIENTKEIKALVDKWLSQNGILQQQHITITIRNKSGEREISNSNLENWQKLIEYFNSKYRQIKFIVITEYKDLFDQKLYERFKNISFLCNEAALSVRFRSSLYEKALINLIVDNGIHVYLTFQKTPYLLFVKCERKDFSKLFGISEGDSFPFATEYQKIIWKRDDYHTLVEETERLYTGIRRNTTVSGGEK